MSELSATWQLQDAKNKFSQVVNNALQHGPQIVTRRGKNAVVILSYDEYLQLQPPERSIADALLRAPQLDEPLDFKLERSQDTWRAVEL